MNTVIIKRQVMIKFCTGYIKLYKNSSTLSDSFSAPRSNYKISKYTGIIYSPRAVDCAYFWRDSFA